MVLTKKITISKSRNRRPRNKMAIAISEIARGPKTQVVFKNKQAKARNGFATVSAPANTAFEFKNRVPTYQGTKNGIIIKHREYVSDITTDAIAGRYNAIIFAINAANSDTFPWLSNIARNYSEYRFKKLHVSVQSLTSTAVNGMIGLASSPDITDNAPNNKSTFMQLENADRCNIWKGCNHIVPSDTLNRLPAYLTAANAIAINEPTKYLGNIFVCTSDSLPGIRVGELYVDYEVELTHPQQIGGAGVEFSGQANVAAGAHDMFATVVIDRFRSNVHVAKENWIASVGSNTIRIDYPGAFMINVQIFGSSFTAAPQFTFHASNGDTLFFEEIYNNISSNTAQVTSLYRVHDADKPFYMFCSSLGEHTSIDTYRISCFSTPNVNTDTTSVSLEDLSRKVSQLELSRSLPSVCEEEKYELVKILKN